MPRIERAFGLMPALSTVIALLAVASGVAFALPASARDIKEVVPPATATKQVWPGDHLTPLLENSILPDWTMFQGNAAHTGYVPINLNVADFTKRWQIPISTVPGEFGTGIAAIATSGVCSMSPVAPS